MGLNKLVEQRNNKNEELDLLNKWIDVFSKYGNERIYRNKLSDLMDCRWLLRDLIMDDENETHLLGMKIAQENQPLIQETRKINGFFWEDFEDENEKKN